MFLLKYFFKTKLKLFLIKLKFSKSFDECLEQAYRFHTGFLTDKARLDGSRFPAGVYYLVLKAGGILTKKIIKIE